jgi:hypothetical protein
MILKYNDKTCKCKLFPWSERRSLKDKETETKIQKNVLMFKKSLGNSENIAQTNL